MVSHPDTKSLNLFPRPYSAAGAKGHSTNTSAGPKTFLFAILQQKILVQVLLQYKVLLSESLLRAQRWLSTSHDSWQAGPTWSGFLWDRHAMGCLATDSPPSSTTSLPPLTQTDLSSGLGHLSPLKAVSKCLASSLFLTPGASGNYQIHSSNWLGTCRTQTDSEVRCRGTGGAPGICGAPFSNW